MGLVKTGNNKDENIQRAYNYLSSALYPNLDSDACDGVLFAMMGRFAAYIFMGQSHLVSEKVAECLTSSTIRKIKRGGRLMEGYQGLLLNPMYTWEYKHGMEVVLAIRDATSVKGKRLPTVSYTV